MQQADRSTVDLDETSALLDEGHGSRGFLFKQNSPVSLLPGYRTKIAALTFLPKVWTLSTLSLMLFVGWLSGQRAAFQATQEKVEVSKNLEVLR